MIRYMTVVLVVIAIANALTLISARTAIESIAEFHGSQRAQSEMALFGPWVFIRILSILAAIHGAIMFFKMFLVRTFVSKSAILILLAFAVLAVVPAIVFNNI